MEEENKNNNHVSELEKTPPHPLSACTPTQPLKRRKLADELNSIDIINNTKEEAPAILQHRLLNDSVHGLIALRKELFDIIDTPEFQRLRDLKQLGGMYYVFPGASHNRFEHCIGTCFLAGQWLRKLREKGEEITDQEIFEVEVAALCHDLGHGPFSHLFETMLEQHYQIHWDHEEASCQLLKQINEKINLLSADSLLRVQNMIRGKVPIGTEKRYLYQIVHNSDTGIDVDKFDYIARDCYCANLPLGYDYKRIMELSKIISTSNHKEIGFLFKESYNIFSMFLTRYKLHKQVYTHRVTKSIELMIGDALVRADDYLKISSIIRDKNYSKYVYLTDSLLKEIERSDDPSLADAKNIIDRMRTRKLYRYVGEVQLLKDFIELQSCKDLVESLQNHFKEYDDDVIVSLIKLDLTQKNNNPMSKVLFIDHMSETMGRYKSAAFISSLSPSECQEVFIRLYSRNVDEDDINHYYSMFQNWQNEFNGQLKPPTPSKVIRNTSYLGAQSTPKSTPSKPSSKSTPRSKINNNNNIGLDDF